MNIQAKAEQEEEFISNTLLKKIQDLKKEKESLALNYEQEEECLTNDLSRKLNQLRQEKVRLAGLHKICIVGYLDIGGIRFLDLHNPAYKLHWQQQF